MFASWMLFFVFCCVGRSKELLDRDLIGLNNLSGTTSKTPEDAVVDAKGISPGAGLVGAVSGREDGPRPASAEIRFSTAALPRASAAAPAALLEESAYTAEPPSDFRRYTAALHGSDPEGKMLFSMLQDGGVAHHEEPATERTLEKVTERAWNDALGSSGDAWPTARDIRGTKAKRLNDSSASLVEDSANRDTDWKIDENRSTEEPLHGDQGSDHGRTFMSSFAQLLHSATSRAAPAAAAGGGMGLMAMVCCCCAKKPGEGDDDGQSGNSEQSSAPSRASTREQQQAEAQRQLEELEALQKKQATSADEGSKEEGS